MAPNPTELKIAVITGGHAYDVPNFHRLFRRLAGVDAYIQSLGEFASSSQETRDAYDAVLFYSMLLETPVDEGRPGYEGKPVAAINRLAETGQGIVLLHHAVLAYPQWPTWREISGISPVLASYQHDQELEVRVTRSSHPITFGAGGFSIIDETYRMAEPDAGNELLLATDHPQSLRALAWVRAFGKARVFCFVLGHDNAAWSNTYFQIVLRRGLAWASRK